MTRLRLWLPLVLLGVCWGQEQPDIKRLEQNLPEIQQAAKELARYAPIVKVIGLVVGVLGLVAGAIGQMQSQTKWHKAAAWAVGIVISALTFVSSYYFVLDHKTLSFLAQDAQSVVEAIKDKVGQYRQALKVQNSPTEARRANNLLREIARNQQKLQEMEQQTREGGHTLRVDKYISFVAPVNDSAGIWPRPAPGGWMSAYAAENEPEWLSKPPYDQYRVGVVGVAAASTSAGAVEAARYNAMVAMARQLRVRQPGLDLDALMSFLERNAQGARNHFTFNSYSRLYWHSMLVFFNRSLLEPKALESLRPVKLASQWKMTHPIKAGYSGVLTVQAPASGWRTVGSGGPANNPTGRGQFEFVLAVQSDAKEARLELEEIRVYEDTSVGTTRWIFKIRVNGQEAIAVPLSRYEDEGKPTRYVVRKEDNRRATIPLKGGGPLVLEVEGFKP